MLHGPLRFNKIHILVVLLLLAPLLGGWGHARGEGHGNGCGLSEGLPGWCVLALCNQQRGRDLVVLLAAPPLPFIASTVHVGFSQQQHMYDSCRTYVVAVPGLLPITTAATAMHLYGQGAVLVLLKRAGVEVQVPEPGPVDGDSPQGFGTGALRACGQTGSTKT